MWFSMVASGVIPLQSMALFLLICIPEHHNTPQTKNQKWPVSLPIKFIVPMP